MKRNNTLAIAFAAILAASSLALPAQAEAAARVTITCDVINSTSCNPVSVVQWLLQRLGIGSQLN